jgi:hypothetical protein
MQQNKFHRIPQNSIHTHVLEDGECKYCGMTEKEVIKIRHEKQAKCHHIYKRYYSNASLEAFKCNVCGYYTEEKYPEFD